MKKIQHTVDEAEKNKSLQITVSSLEKIFPDKKPTLLQSEFCVFKNETFHFQVACYTVNIRECCIIEVESDLGDKVSVRRVEYLPSNYAMNIFRTDDYVLKKKPNGQIFPDLLKPVCKEGESLRQNSWSTFWVTVDATNGLPVGDHQIKIRIKSKLSDHDKTSIFNLSVLDDVLPETDFRYTCWMHYDCIASTHSVEMFSNEYYAIFDNYLKSAVKHGMTMLYTPIFTPALDTAVGHYRDTAQLVEVKVIEGHYVFDFAKLDYFINFVLQRGIKYLEFSHLATQWGANCCPKVVAQVDGVEKRIFGWDVLSDSKEYLTFLDAFLSEFKLYVAKKGIEDIIYFHISDEPTISVVEKFKKIRDVLIKHFPNAKCMDALSDSVYRDEGLINHPVVCTDHYKNFKSNWVYYCCVQTFDYLSNRLFNMPSQRTRVLGYQLYRNDCNGFLHWAFNFYNSAGSLSKINPYVTTDTGGHYQSGDSFVVYPSNDGVYESLRHEVLGDVFYDYRALKLLESYIGRENVIKMLDDAGLKEGFTVYKRSARWHLSFRRKINKLIIKNKYKHYC